ncbi:MULTISPECIES: sensor histidine kinase [Robinsoniella]|uniref:sensor histidine kinase n=1 Tax=Robinsoniella TaxID=588605 RepID=UPI000486ECBF|nr:MULTISPECIES: sensor histidine kinase [Robinsoniella]
MKAKIKIRIKKCWNYIAYRFRTAGISTLISASFSITAVISMGFAGILLYGKFSSSTEELIIKNSEQLVNQVSLNLENYVRGMMRISDSMYYSVIKKVDLSTDNLDKEMNLLYEANKDDLISIACFDDKQQLVGAAPVASMKENLDITVQDWYKRANAMIENLHFSTPHVQNLFEDSAYRYNWVVSLSRIIELTDDGDIRRGILLVDMSFSGIEQLFYKVNTDSDGYIYLIGGEGEIIYHPRQKAIYSKLNTENNLRAATYDDGTHRETFDGIERSVTVKTVGYTGWKIVSVVPTAELYLSLTQIQFFVITIVIFAILLMSILNMLISTRIATPIKKLEDSVKELEKGNLSLNIYEGGSHEIRHLGRTIRSMVVQMQKLMADIVQEQESKRKSELDALQSQINPHFLYNTLDSIVWMIEVEQYKEAISMVTALARLFRISLSKGKTIITIYDELEHARNYMNIQKTRYKNRFVFKINVDAAIMEYSTIKLIIQPILENAIYYGMEYMDGDGLIEVKGYEKDGDIFIDVVDNGLGIPKEMVDYLLTDNGRIHKKGSGVGLVNVHQRIRLYFGKPYGLEIQSELDIGTTVRIHLPKKPL